MYDYICEPLNLKSHSLMNADQDHTYFRFYLENHRKGVFDTSSLPFHAAFISQSSYSLLI